MLASPGDLQRILSQARPGDTILLEGGSYGAIKLSGNNSDFVTLGAVPGQTPVLASLLVVGSHWWIRDLTIDANSAEHDRLPPTQPGKWQFHDWLVKLRGGDNIVLSHNQISSMRGDFPWRPETAGVDDATPLWSGILAQNSACVILRGNKISNVFNGIAVEGDQEGANGMYYQIQANIISDFAGDGIDHSVSHALISKNIISRNHNICASICIHSDGIQGWNYHNEAGILNTDILLDGNAITQGPGGDPIASGDALQGITIFDGFWKDIRVTNNVVVTVAWHGITIDGADGVLIANNTVVGSTKRATWISAGGSTHQGGTSDRVVVRNNLASSFAIPKAFTEKVQFDHNLTVTHPVELFKAFDPPADHYDLHLRAGSAAKGLGSHERAPDRDFDGTPRSGRVDLGAYQATP